VNSEGLALEIWLLQEAELAEDQTNGALRFDHTEAALQQFSTGFGEQRS
jgi:hypothetical protein